MKVKKKNGIYKLTLKQKRFCEFYADHGNATKAAKQAGYSEKTARESGWENTNKPELIRYIDNLVNEKYQENKKKFGKYFNNAMKALVEVSDSGNPTARVLAANSILDRAGFAATQKIQSESKIDADVKSDINLHSDAVFTIKIPNSTHSDDGESEKSESSE